MPLYPDCSTKQPLVSRFWTRRRSRTSRAGRSPLAGFLLREIGRNRSQRVLQTESRRRAVPRGHSRHVTQRRGIAAEGPGDFEIQCAGEFILRARVIFTVVEQNATVEMRLSGNQVLRCSKCRAAGEVVIGHSLGGLSG